MRRVAGGVQERVHALVDGVDPVQVRGGDLDGDAINVAPVPLTTVTSNGETYEADTIAFAARGTVAYTMAIAQNAQLTFSGTADYMSAVATPAVNASISAETLTLTTMPVKTRPAGMGLM